MPTKQAKNWCWTLNNYTEEEHAAITQLGHELTDDVCYLIFGQEEGEEKTPHLQGYICFSKRKSFGIVKKLIGKRCHLEAAKGSPAQNEEYCSKGSNIETYGKRPAGQGARNDLVQVAEACKRGDSYQEIADAFPAAALRYSTGILRLRSLCRPERNHPPELWCLWGRTGTGKTRRIWEFADVDKLWVHPGDRWFDGYDGQPAVLFDDYDGSWFKITYLLKLIDRYIFQVPIKGSYTWWAPRVIYFTSNHHPKEWYPGAKAEHIAALLRRFNEFGTIEECKTNY